MIELVVGKKTYDVWTDMLKNMVPDGRTHRLSVLLGGMLVYAEQIAFKKSKSNSVARKLTLLFEEAYENYIEGDVKDLLDLAESLLKDAKVKYKRVSSRGDCYSIAEEAVYQYLHWEDMPWEG